MYEYYLLFYNFKNGGGIGCFSIFVFCYSVCVRVISFGSFVCRIVELKVCFNIFSVRIVKFVGFCIRCVGIGSIIVVFIVYCGSFDVSFFFLGEFKC